VDNFLVHSVHALRNITATTSKLIRYWIDEGKREHKKIWRPGRPRNCFLVTQLTRKKSQLKKN